MFTFIVKNTILWKLSYYFAVGQAIKKLKIRRSGAKNGIHMQRSSSSWNRQKTSSAYESGKCIVPV